MPNKFLFRDPTRFIMVFAEINKRFWCSALWIKPASCFSCPCQTKSETQQYWSSPPKLFVPLCGLTHQISNKKQPSGHLADTCFYYLVQLTLMFSSKIKIEKKVKHDRSKFGHCRILRPRSYVDSNFLIHIFDLLKKSSQRRRRQCHVSALPLNLEMMTIFRGPMPGLKHRT